tara:strand:+ start:541 stop:1272 length:732 start_codon:yes stop_codon:yes gene_type:complete
MSDEDYEMASRTGGIPSKREIMPGQFQHIGGSTHGGIDPQGQHQTLTEGMARQLAMGQRGDIGRTDENLLSESGRSKPWPSPYASQMTDAPEELGSHPPISGRNKWGWHDRPPLTQGGAQRGPRIQEEPKTKPEDFTMDTPMNQAIENLHDDEDPEDIFTNERLRNQASKQRAEEDKTHIAEQDEARVAQILDRPLESEMERREKKRTPSRGNEAKTERMREQAERNRKRKEEPIEKAWAMLR